MSNLDFNVQLTMATEQFNQAVNTVVRNTTGMQTRLSQAIQDINTNSQTAQTAVAKLMTVNDAKFVASMNNATKTLNGLQAGARLSDTAVNDAITRMQTHITGLNSSLTTARANLSNLQMSGATTEQIANAEQEVNRLRTAISNAKKAQNGFMQATNQSLARVGQTAQTAQNSIYQMLNIRTGSSIQAEINQINAEMRQLRNNSALSGAEIQRVTQAGRARIAELRTELSQTNRTMTVLNGGIGAVRGGVQGLSGAVSGLTGLLAMLGAGVGAMELIQLAESFKAIQAQIRLAVGDGTAFINAMQTVTDIANETRMPLDEVANLYARIDRAGKEMALSSSDVAEVTMTINKAMQVSGGSASSLNAALTQLIQGLQSGVLRGEEFNSVMEQSPRLARALADGLGVGVGELRNMAGEGKLTSEVVIGALKSQTDVINAEFAKMPVTVEGSLTVLKNKFMAFVGGIDGELQQTSAISNFILQIGNAFDEIDQTTIDAIKTAFEQLGILAKTLWDNFGMVGDRLTDLFSVFDGTEEAGEKVSALTRFVQLLGVGIGFVSDGVNALGIVGDMVFGGWLQIIGKIVGAFENLMGNVTNYGDRLVEQGTKAVERAKTNMVNFSSQGAKALEEMGKTEQQRLEERAKQAKETYIKMLADGTESAEKLKEARLKAIEAEIIANKNVVSEVHERELAEMNLQAVISKTGELSFKVLDETVENTAKIKAQIKSATKALEIDSEKAMEKTSNTFNEFKVQLDNLINGYDEMTKQGLNASEMLTQGLDTMLKKAKNTHDVKAIIELWKELGEQGKITGEQLADGIKTAKDKLDELEDGINSTTEAYKLMGLQSQAELQRKAEQYRIAYEMIKKSGTATADTLKQAYEKYAKAQMLADDGVANGYVQNEARQHGLAVAIDKTGKQSIKTAKDVESSYEKMAKSAEKATNVMVEQANEVSTAWHNANDSIRENITLERERNEALTVQVAGIELGENELFKTASEVVQKTINVNIKQGDKMINTSIPAGQETSMIDFLRQLENDKAISGY